MDFKLFDHFFSDDTIDKIKLFFTPQYSYVSDLDNNIKKEHSWTSICFQNENTNLLTDKPFWRKDLNDEPLFITEIKDIIIFNLLQKTEEYDETNMYIKKNKQYVLKRVYAVSQTYEQNSNYHIDDVDERSFTFVLYINNNYNDSDGFFYIKPNTKTIYAIEPKYNRGILFPSKYRHKGSGYNRFDNNLRICVAWKFYVELNPSPEK